MPVLVQPHKDTTKRRKGSQLRCFLSRKKEIAFSIQNKRSAKVDLWEGERALVKAELREVKIS